MPWAIVGLVLVALWGAFLLPEVLGSRKSAPLASTQEFDRWTNRIAIAQRPNGPAQVARTRVLVRRRRMLILLVSAAVLSLIAAILFSAPAVLVVHIVVDAMVAWYLAMLVQLKHRRADLARVTPVRPASDGVQEMPSTPDIHILASG